MYSCRFYSKEVGVIYFYYILEDHNPQDEANLDTISILWTFLTQLKKNKNKLIPLTGNGAKI